jgi:arabinogalactan endo-1,4-beta-galactosidase
MAGSVSKHTVKGTADGKEATCYISVVEYNYLKNDSFEDGVLEPWVITDNGKADELYVEDKLTDSMTGNFHMHFWSAAANSVNFTLDQTLTDLTPGKYKFTISIMGGDAGEHEVFAYAKVNGEYYTTNTLEITTYGNWDTVTLRNIELTQGDELTVGIYVCCSGAGNGAWGKIDDAMLNSDN